VPRAAIVVCLPDSELRAVRKHLTDAGFEAITVKSASDVEKVLAKRDDVKVAILDTETDFDGSIAMYGILRRDGRNTKILMLVPVKSLGRIGLNRGVDPRDEYFTRPYSAESVRWRIEAMLIRAESPHLDEAVPLIEAAGIGASDDFVGGESPAGTDDQGAIVSFNRASDVSPGRLPTTGGKIVIVFNPKGGVGKTTMSINLGAALQVRRGKRVLLVDCDTITGHVASSLGLERPRTLANAWREDRGGAADEPVEQIATLHISGLSVLVLSESPLRTEVLEPHRVAEAICAARDSYDWIILDMHPDYGPLNRALFEQADRIVVPITPDIPCIRAAIQFREVATQLGLHDRMMVVINRANSGVATADLQRVVDLPVLGRVRSAGLLFVRASDEGRSAVERFPTSKVVADIDAMAQRLLDGVHQGDGRFASAQKFAESVKGFLRVRARPDRHTSLSRGRQPSGRGPQSGPS
jgi:MinD-like ATPase involved in chromosome partitioning or flagellar assembly